VQPHLICLVLLTECNMIIWHLITSLCAALLFLLAIVIYVLLVLKMLHADCIAPVTNKCMPQENLSDLVNPLH
jgi:hypothetical protein